MGNESEGAWMDQVERFVAALREQLGPRLVSVVLYGSRARGDYRDDSDVDLLIVATELPRSRLDRGAEFRALAKEISPSLAPWLSMSYLTPQEASRTKPFYLGMIHGSRVLFDRNFFQPLLNKLKARLGDIGAERRFDSKGYEYWVLLRDYTPGASVDL